MMFFRKRGDGAVPSEKKLIFPKRFFVILLSIIAVGGIVTSVFLYIKYQKVQKALNNPSVAGQIEAQDLVKKVAHLMVLPDGEIPTVATVSDENKLKDQQFFHNAKNGDKLLIYAGAKLAVLYNPQSDKIVNVGPLNIEQGKGQVAGDSASASPVRVALYNGTDVAGLTTTVEQQLKSKNNNISISSRENAKNKYTKTLVVDLSGNQQKVAVDVAKQLNGEVGSLPAGETAPANTDFLVILGK